MDRGRSRVLWGVGLTMLVLSAGLARADEGGARVTLVARDETIQTVAERLSEAGGQVVGVQRGVARRRVSVQIVDLPLAAALQLVAEVAGLEVSRSNNVWILHRPGESPGAAFTTITAESVAPPPAERGKVRKLTITCRHVPPSVIAAAFGRPAVMASGGGVALMRPTYHPPALLHGFVGPPVALTEVPTQLADAEDRAAARWATEPAPEPAHDCHAALSVPPGVLAVIGYDPSSTLVLVGEPEAVEAFARIAGQLDLPSTRLETRITAYLVPSDRLAGLTWQPRDVLGGQASAWLTTMTAGDAEQSLRGLAAGQVFGLDPVIVDNAEPVVASLSLGLGFPGGPPAPKEGEIELATSDTKIVSWVTPGGISVSVEPTYGEAAVLLRGMGGLATVGTRVPCAASSLEVRVGDTLIIGGLQPKGEFRAADAGASLGQLPLVGGIYRPVGGATPPMTVILAVTVRPLGG